LEAGREEIFRRSAGIPACWQAGVDRRE